MIGCEELYFTLSLKEQDRSIFQISQSMMIVVFVHAIHLKQVPLVFKMKLPFVMFLLKLLSVHNIIIHELNYYGLNQSLLLFTDYLSNPHYFGVTIGRIANRIANAKFSLDGKEYQLGANESPNNHHGGFIGFGKVVTDRVRKLSLKLIYFKII